MKSPTSLPKREDAKNDPIVGLTEPAGMPASRSSANAPKRSMMADRSAASSEASPAAFADGGVAMSGEDGS